MVVMMPVRRCRHAKTAAFRHPPGGSRGVVLGPAVAAPTASQSASRCRASQRQSETARKPRPSLAGARFGLGVLRGRLVLFVAVVRSGPVWVVLFSWSVRSRSGSVSFLVLVPVRPAVRSGSARLVLLRSVSVWSVPGLVALVVLACCHRLHVVCSRLGMRSCPGLSSPPRLGLFLAWPSPFRLACCRRPARGLFPAWHALLSWSVVTTPSRSVPGLAFTVPLGLLPPSCVLSTAISCHPSASRTTPYRSASHRPWPHSTSTIQTHPATPPEHPATRASNPSITTTRHHQTHHTTRACNSPQKTPHNSSTPNNAGLS